MDNKEAMDNEDMVVVGGRYQHYKNKKTYRVVAIALHTETHEEIVVYQGEYTDPELGENPVFVRPFGMFVEEVIVDGKKMPRFAAL